MTASVAASASRLSIDIGCLSLCVDGPARDGVVMIVAAEAALSSELGARRLHHPGLVGGAALQDRRSAIPLPCRAEAHGCFWQVRILQGGRRPGLSAVGRD